MAGSVKLALRRLVGVVNTSDTDPAPPLFTRRTTFILLLVTTVATGLVFGLYPQFDLQISGLFYDPVRRTWPADHTALFGFHRNLSILVTAILVIIVVGARALAAIRRREASVITRRVAGVLIGSLLLGPGLIANVLLKPYWGRPRPGEVTAFGGTLDFTAWWNPHGQCDSNCSFVSGEESLAVWLFAWAVVLPARYRGPALVVAALHSAFMAAGRLTTGAHFASDLLFAVMVTGWSIWLMHWLLLRAPRAATTSRGADGPHRDLAASLSSPRTAESCRAAR